MLEVEPGVTSGDYLFGFFQGTRRALTRTGASRSPSRVDRSTPRTLGALIALYERAVGLYASLVNINAYHQPGVEAGKKAAQAVLDLQVKVLAALRAGARAMTAADAAKAAGTDDVETVFWILRHAAANPAHKVTRALEPGKPALDATFKAI